MNSGTSTAVRATFRDEKHQRAFAEDGFTVIDLVDPDVARGLADRFVDLYVGRREGFHSSLESTDYDYRDELHHELMATLGHVIDEWFDDHEAVMAAATVKWNGAADSTVGVHQDWSLVDERSYRSCNIWIPLVDLCAENGGLLVLPGSHRDHQVTRIHGGFPSWYEDPAMTVDPEAFVAVPLQVGQAIVTDHALLHRSPPNRSEAPRVAVVMGLKPAEATLYHWYRDADDQITRYTIEDPAFFRRVVAYQDPAAILADVPSQVVEFEVARPEPPEATDEVPTPPAAPVAAATAGSGPIDDRAPTRLEAFWRHVRRGPRAQTAPR